MRHIYDIVGSYFRQRDHESPAQDILKHLSAGTSLIVRANPTNPVDPNAIAIWIKTENLPISKEFILDIAGSGWEEEELYDNDELPLGYIPAKDAKTIKLGSDDIEGKLIFGLDDKYKVSFETTE